MDYQKMLFAFKVRDLAAARVVERTPNMSNDDRKAYSQEHIVGVIFEIIEEVEYVANVVDEISNQKAAAKFEKLGG